MNDIDLTEAVEAVKAHGNRTHSHLRPTGPGMARIDYEAILAAALPAIREQLARQSTAAAAEAVSGLHPHSTVGASSAGHARPGKHADQAAQGVVSVADRIEAEEDRIRRLTPGDAGWESPAFRAGMLHAAAIVRAES